MRYRVWTHPVSQFFLDTFGFVERNGYWDKTVRSQMTTDYIKIYVTSPKE